MLAVRGSQNWTDPAGRKSTRTQGTCKTERLVEGRKATRKFKAKGQHAYRYRSSNVEIGFEEGLGPEFG